jgi:hypothetical protein
MGVGDADPRDAALGVTAPLAFPGGTDTTAFHQYVEEILAPELRPGDVVI